MSATDSSLEQQQQQQPPAPHITKTKSKSASLSLARKVVWGVGLVPAAIVVFRILPGYAGLDRRKHLAYHVTGEWALRFLIASLSMSPIAALCKELKFVKLSKKTLHNFMYYRRSTGILSFVYVFLHFVAHILLDGGLLALAKSLLVDPVVITGMLAFLLYLPLISTSYTYGRNKLAAYKQYFDWWNIHKLVYGAAVLSCAHLLVLDEPQPKIPILIMLLLGLRLFSKKVRDISKRKRHD